MATERCMASINPSAGSRPGESYPCGAVAKTALIFNRAHLCLTHHKVAFTYGIALSTEVPRYNRCGTEIYLHGEG